MLLPARCILFSGLYHLKGALFVDYVSLPHVLGPMFASDEQVQRHARRSCLCGHDVRAPAVSPLGSQSLG